jgi:eukaryotic-like serine/threonine-protein kinase
MAARFLSLGPLPSAGASTASLGLAIIDEVRAEPVVLVWLPPQSAAQAEALQAMRRETERAVQLEHPNIVRVWGLAKLEAGIARVVEYADGENLRRVLEVAGPLPPEVAARLIADASQGVHFAHLAGNDDGSPLPHGDLRPETLIVSYAGACKVAGYGAAFLAPKKDRARELHGAPEQIVGGRGAANVHTDIYLLGLALFEVLTGKVPFAEAEDLDRAVLASDLDLSVHPEVPASLAPIISRALAKKAADRFPTALAFRDALEAAVSAIATPEAVAQWLDERFPEGVATRAERRRILDVGIADFARELASRPPPPAVVAAPPAPPAVAQPPSAAKVSRPPPAARAQVSTGPEPVSTSYRAERVGGGLSVMSKVAIGGGLVLAVGWLALSRGSSDRPTPVPPSVAMLQAAQQQATTPALPEPQGASEPTLAAVETPAEAAPTSASAPAAAPAGATLPAVASAELPILELFVDPPVDVEIDGEPAGRTPLTKALSPGRHRLNLVNAAAGIKTVRFTELPASGKHREQVYLQKGYIVVSAPDGAVIRVNGRKVGTAPVSGEISLWEGAHRLEVSMGKATWRQSFSLRGNERMYFNAYPTYD